MKYKVGDLVRIRTWEELIEKYGLNEWRDIIIFYDSRKYRYTEQDEEIINEKFPDRVVEIEKISKKRGRYYYNIKGFRGIWVDELIKEKVKNHKEPIPINSRFDILDIR